ncbi:MAG TPA: phosphatidylserine decarboxylase [Candidatus Binataceae bacterium]|nr:phosphatidylserine decarboxylase [Candidatus Binataceae bacterium]
MDPTPQSPTGARACILDRAACAIGIAPEGGVIVAAVVIIAVVLLTTGFFPLGVVAAIAAVAIGMFFRDPERFPSASDRAVLSAADGVVCAIDEAPMPDGDPAPCRRVSVFMSPLNVHVNRAPVAGEIVSTKHTAGAFSAAFRDIASEHNERNMIILKDSAGRLCGVMQIAGYLARRIVCRVAPGDAVARGQRVGLIMFGSRVDHFFSPEYAVTVKIGDKVRAGESIIGELQL